MKLGYVRKSLFISLLRQQVILCNQEPVFYLLIPYGARFVGHVQTAKKGHFLIRNGVLTLQNDSLDVLHQPLLRVNGIAEIKTPKSDSRYRKIFKGEKLTVDRGEFLYLKLLEPIKVDISTGRLLRNPELEYKNNAVLLA